MKRETRDIEFRFALPEGGEPGTFEGYAARFGELDAYQDMLTPGAFARTLAEHRARGTMPKMFWSHDPAEPIGVWDEISEDANGLKVRGHLIMEVARAASVHALMRAGAIDGLSIGFRTRKATTDKNGVRTVSDVNLVEISPVALPAAPRARITSFRNDRSSATVAAFITAAKAASSALKG